MKGYQIDLVLIVYFNNEFDVEIMQPIVGFGVAKVVVFINYFICYMLDYTVIDCILFSHIYFFFYHL